MKIIIDNQSSKPDFLALDEVRSVMLLPYWDEIQANGAGAYYRLCFERKLKLDLARSGDASSLHFVASDLPDAEAEARRSQPAGEITGGKIPAFTPVCAALGGFCLPPLDGGQEEGAGQ